jgi:hypothetical protein
LWLRPTISFPIRSSLSNNLILYSVELLAMSLNYKNKGERS